MDNVRLYNYTEHLKTITSGMVEMAEADGHPFSDYNSLLRECYNLIGVEMHTREEWEFFGYTIRNGQYGYLFWNTPIRTRKQMEDATIILLYAKEQTKEIVDRYYLQQSCDDDCFKDNEPVTFYVKDANAAGRIVFESKDKNEALARRDELQMLSEAE